LRSEYSGNPHQRLRLPAQPASHNKLASHAGYRANGFQQAKLRQPASQDFSGKAAGLNGTLEQWPKIGNRA